MKRIFLICLILVIISISAVSATENITDNLHTGDLNETIQVTNAKSFTDLDTDINSNTNSQITLKSDYIYNSTTDSANKNSTVKQKIDTPKIDIQTGKINLPQEQQEQ